MLQNLVIQVVVHWLSHVVVIEMSTLQEKIEGDRLSDGIITFIAEVWWMVCTYLHLPSWLIYVLWQTTKPAHRTIIYSICLHSMYLTQIVMWLACLLHLKLLKIVLILLYITQHLACWSTLVKVAWMSVATYMFVVCKYNI